MIWPTFLKDFRLLWPLAILTAALQAFTTWLSVRSYIQSAPTMFLPPIVQQSSIVPMLSAALLCALLIRQDPPQGERNDWLTRPLPRSRIALTKIVSVLVMIHLPVLAIDFGFGLAIGIELPQALLAGLLRSIYLFGVISLPALGVASLVPTLGQAIAGAIGLSALLYFMDSAVIRFDTFTSVNGEQRSLPAMAAFPLSVAAMGALALGLQFPLRKPGIAALAAAPFAALAVLTFDPGWPRLLGLNPSMHPGERAKTASFTLVFDQTRGPFNHNGDPTLWQLRNPSVIDNIAGKRAASYRRMYPSLPGEKTVYLFLPVRSIGTPPGEVWMTANPKVVIRDQTGAAIFIYNGGIDLPIPGPGIEEPDIGFANGDRMVDDGVNELGISLAIPPGLLRLRGDEPVSIEAVFDIWFLHKAREAPIARRDQAIPGFGACRLVSPRPISRSWRVNCLQPRSPPFCITLNVPHQSDWVPSCSALYLPVSLGHMMTGPYPRNPQGGGIVADPDASLVIQDWRPAGYAHRVLRMDGIKLKDWTSAANERPRGPDGLPTR